MTKIKYKTKLTPFKKNERPAFSAVVVHNGTIGEDTFYEKVSDKCGLDITVVKSIFELAVKQMGEELRNGMRVELPGLSAYLTLPGNFASTSAESRRAVEPRLVARISAKGAFKNCCAGDEFVLENISQGATVVIRGVSDMLSRRDNVLTNGTDVEVHIVGTGLYMPDMSDPSTGVWLETTDGTVCATAQVTESSSTLLICEFGEIDQREGTYKLCVASRNGLDPEHYGVTVARRNVTVVNAAANEGGTENG